MLIIMTITGSIPILFYYLIHIFLKDQMNSGVSCVLLFLSVLSFIFPFPVWTYKFRNIFYDCTHIEVDWTPKAVSSPIFSVNDQVVFFYHRSILFYLLLFIWVSGVLICLIRDFISYYRLRKKFV